MNLDKQQLVKTLTQTAPNQLLALTITSLDKDSSKAAITVLSKFLSKNSDYIVIAIRK
jgi:hypothetical protein